MWAYVVRRLLYAIPVTLGVIVLLFLLFSLVGGDPTALLAGKIADKTRRYEIRHEYGYIKPLILDMDALGGHDDELETLVDGLSEEGGKSLDRIERRLVELADFAVPVLAGLVLDGSTEPIVRERAAEFLGYIVNRSQSIPAEAPVEERTKSIEAWREWWEESEGRYEITIRRRAAIFFDSQLLRFLDRIATWDLEKSHKTKRGIGEMIDEGIWRSLALSVPAFVMGTLIAIYVALFCAIYRNTWIDRSMVVFCVLGMSLSILVYAMGAQYLLAYRWKLFPIMGYESGLGALKYVLLPGLIWVFAALGADVRFFRTVILDEIHQDYVRTAAAKGLHRNPILFKHVLKNAMIPILTHVVIAIPFLYTGSLVLENFFGINGLGRMTVQAVNQADFPVVRWMTLIGALLYIAANLATDVLYALVDPRVRLG